jgi:hypothetical protein
MISFHSAGSFYGHSQRCAVGAPGRLPRSESKFRIERLPLAFAGCFGATRKHSHNKRLTAGTALR